MAKKTARMPNDIGKLPPQALQEEEAILGALMLESNAIENVITIITSASFYRHEHQLIYTAISELYNVNMPIDLLTVSNKLRKNETLEDVGGIAKLTDLTLRVGSASHIEFHARIVQQEYLKRELILISSDINTSSYDSSIDVADIIEKAQLRINKIATSNVKKTARRMSEIIKPRMEKLEKASKSEEKATGIKSYKKLDKITAGWQPGNLIIMGARPAMGKTRLAQEFAKIASIYGSNIAFFSLEMSDEELFDRELSNSSGIENMYIRQADIRDNDWPKLEQAISEIENMNIFIDDTPALTITEFKAKARLYRKKHNIDFIIVDYLQLMKYPEYAGYREREISEISAALKATAKELNIPIMALSQLSRKIEERHDKRPLLSDLRESGSIEQDADIIIFPFRPEVYDPDNPEYKNLIELIIAKNRHGAIGPINLYKTSRWTHIYENRMSDVEEDLPY
jgi:replicative DNA helicase